MTLPCWPDGARCGAALTFDVDADSFTIAENPAAADDPAALSMGLYDIRVGVPAILDVLKDADVSATFFVPGVIAERFPRSIEQLLADGHELAAHGYTHTPPSQLTATEEAIEVSRVAKTLRDFGVEVTGYRTPSWSTTRHTLRLLRENGFEYSSNFMDDVRPYRHQDTDLVELPVHWLLDDAAHWWIDLDTFTKTIATNADVRSIWEDEHRGIQILGGCSVFTMHPNVTGRPGRLPFLAELACRLRDDSDTYLSTCKDLAKCLL